MTTKTVKELKQEIKIQKSMRTAVPGARKLRTSGVAVVESAELGVDQKVEVYANGFVLYHHETHQTVFNLHKVEDTYYSTADEEKNPLPWYFHLMMVGDDRIMNNKEKADEKRMVTKEEIIEDNNVAFKDCGQKDPLEKILERERLSFICSYLTEYQKLVVVLYFMERMTQEEIADYLGKSREAIKKTLLQAVNKLKKHKGAIAKFYEKN